MCGIVAYIGENAENTLFGMLKKLEYRGYDSAGIATIFHDDLDVIKTEGKVENLKNKLTGKYEYTCYTNKYKLGTPAGQPTASQQKKTLTHTSVQTKNGRLCIMGLLKTSPN